MDDYLSVNAMLSIKILMTEVSDDDEEIPFYAAVAILINFESLLYQNLKLR